MPTLERIAFLIEHPGLKMPLRGREALPMVCSRQLPSTDGDLKLLQPGEVHAQQGFFRPFPLKKPDRCPTDACLVGHIKNNRALTRDYLDSPQSASRALLLIFQLKPRAKRSGHLFRLNLQHQLL